MAGVSMILKSIAAQRTPYIIAEIGANHNGDMELAKALIKKAKEAGADCAKFQSWTKHSNKIKKVYEDNFFLDDDYRDKNVSLEQTIEKYSMTEEKLLEVNHYCKGIGIQFASTPFTEGEVDFLVDVLDVPFIKVASMDCSNYPFLEYIAKKQLPVILSTGLSELHEIDKAVKTIEKEGNSQIALLHCVSIYPPNDADVNLRKIVTLQKIYPYQIGFSDHTIGTSIPIAASALGVAIIEKHFTLDKASEGWDHKVSADFDDLSYICRETKRITHAMGSYEFKSVESERRKHAFRRSVVSAKSIEKGKIITAEDLTCKRPGDGIPPEGMKYIIGRIALKNIEEDVQIDNKCF
jgi:sialic acid synthase SpsE